MSIGLGQHSYSKLSTNAYFIEEPYKVFTKRECIIKNNVWIDSYAMIMRGVIIGNGAVIGGNSVVIKDVPDYAIVVGCPAKIIKYRFDKEIISELKN